MNTLDTVRTAIRTPLARRSCGILAAVVIASLPCAYSYAQGGNHGHGAGGNHGIVYVTPNAEGRVLPLVDEYFTLVPVHNPSPKRRFPSKARGVILDGEDLTDNSIVLFAQRAFDLGLTVAIAEADADEVESLRLLVGRDLPIAFPLPPGEEMPLIALRDDLTVSFTGASSQTRHGTYLLHPRQITDDPTPPGGHEESDANEAYALRRAFLYMGERGRDRRGPRL